MTKEKKAIKNSNSIQYCPDCKTKVKHIDGMNTDWYGRLDYYECKCCNETFVSRDGGELHIAVL